MTAVVVLLVSAAITGDRASLARLPWPVTTAAEDAELAAHAGALDAATRAAWGRDRLLPALAGLLPAEVARLAIEAAGTGGSSAMTVLDEARKAYGAGRSEEAVRLYGEVPQDSSLWPEALGERAWALGVLGRVEEALGAAVSLRAPYFAAREQVEAELLEATSLVGRCRFEEARALVDRIGARDVAAGRESPLLARVRAGLEVARRLRPERVVAVEALLEQIAGDDARAREALRRSVRERALAIRYESLREERRLLESGLAPLVARKPEEGPLGDDEIAWTFDGTFWRDELGAYRVVAGDACPRERTP